MLSSYDFRGIPFCKHHKSQTCWPGVVDGFTVERIVATEIDANRLKMLLNMDISEFPPYSNNVQTRKTVKLTIWRCQRS